MTIPVNNVTGIAGLMKAGDRVDIILVLNFEGGGTHSEVILQNVLLLSINRNANRYVQTPKDKKAKEDKEAKEELPNSLEEEKSEDESVTKEMAKEVTKQVLHAQTIPSSGAVGTVTLALKPDEVMKVISATTIGKIHLALRSRKPRGDSMYIQETDYYTATDSAEPPQPKTLPQSSLPVIPSAPVPPSPTLPAIPNNSVNPTEQNSAFEIIQWGN